MGGSADTVNPVWIFYFMANTGQIVKSKSTERFTTIPNEVCRSMDLTMEEKGMLIFLLSLPSDWVLYRANLYKSLNDSKGAIDRVFKSLQTKGYILSVRVHDQANGKFIGWNHVVYDLPAIDTENQIHRDGQNPISVNTEVGESASILKKDSITKEILNTNKDFKTKEKQVLVFLGCEWSELWQQWCEYKQTEFRDKYKSEKSEQVAINLLVEISGGQIEQAKKIVEHSIANRYKGLFKLKTNSNDTTKTSIDFYNERRNELHRIAEEFDRQRGIRP